MVDGLYKINLNSNIFLFDRYLMKMSKQMVMFTTTNWNKLTHRINDDTTDMIWIFPTTIIDDGTTPQYLDKTFGYRSFVIVQIWPGYNLWQRKSGNKLDIEVWLFFFVSPCKKWLKINFYLYCIVFLSQLVMFSVWIELQEKITLSQYAHDVILTSIQRP